MKLNLERVPTADQIADGVAAMRTTTREDFEPWRYPAMEAIIVSGVIPQLLKTCEEWARGQMAAGVEIPPTATLNAVYGAMASAFQLGFLVAESTRDATPPAEVN
jgi:hypothetical protein